MSASASRRRSAAGDPDRGRAFTHWMTPRPVLSLRLEEVVAEAAVPVEPLPLNAEAACAGQGVDLGEGVLVRVLGVDRLAGREVELLLQPLDPDHLLLRAHHED